MTEEQINEAIRSHLGWIKLDNGLYAKEGFLGRKMGCDMDYCNDLNAMHEAEETLKITIGRVDVMFSLAENEANRFNRYLYEICVRDDDSHPISASARQRAEAFLKTVGAK